MTTGAELKRRRKALGLSQVLLARHVGVTQRTLSHWERNDRSPRAENLFMLQCKLQELESEPDTLSALKESPRIIEGLLARHPA